MDIGSRPMTPATENRQARGIEKISAYGRRKPCARQPRQHSSLGAEPHKKLTKLEISPGPATCFPSPLFPMITRRSRAGVPSVPGWMGACRPMTRSCCCPSAALRGPTTCCRSSRTSPAAAASPASGWPRSPSTTTPSAGSARSTPSAASCSPTSARRALTCRCTGGTGTGTRSSKTPCGRWPTPGCSARSRSSPPPTAPTRPVGSTTTTSTGRLPRSARGRLRIDKIRPYFNHPGFIEPWAAGVAEALATLDPEARARARLVCTAHSVPGGDGRRQRQPYRGHVGGSVTGGRSAAAMPPSSGKSQNLSPNGPWMAPCRSTSPIRVAAARRACPGSSRM